MRNLQPDHYEHCAELHPNKGPSGHAAQGKLRWPGAVGSRWETGRGVLFIGSVHTHFHKGTGGRVDPGLTADLVEANEAWRDAGRSASADAAYLRRTSQAYEKGTTF